MAKLRFVYLVQAGERNFFTSFHTTWGPPFSAPLYCKYSAARWGRTRHGCDGAAAARARDLCDALPSSAPNLLACDRDRSDGILRGPEGRGGQFGGAAAVAGGVRLVAAAPLDFAVRSELRSGPQVW